MRPPRVTTRRLLALVAALAVILGILMTLHRRRERFRALAAEHFSAINAVYFGDADAPRLTGAAAGYHRELSSKYQAAADRPWLPVAPDPPPTEGVRAFQVAHAAVKRAYPGVALDDYTAQVNVFTGAGDRPAPEGRTVWHVKFRKRDNRSGLNVIVDDPVEIYIHRDGPPPGGSNPQSN